MHHHSFVRNVVRWAAVAIIAAVISACQTSAPKVAAPIPLELVAVGTLHVPDTCEATGSVIVDFTVLENGQTAGIEPAAAPECLQQALTAWVASFRYAPVTSQTRTSVEWLMVEARRGS